MDYECAIIEVVKVQENIIMLSVGDGNGNSGDLGWGEL